jgi:hypothetical protein
LKIELEVSEETEGTAYPWWFICDPCQNMRMDLAVAAMSIRGPFFSREEAEAQLEATRYRFSKRAAVWCASGYDSRSYKAAMNTVWKAREEEKNRPLQRFVYLPEPVCGDGPFAATRAEAGVYEAHFNPEGAVFVKATNGKLLGVKPGEFIDAGGVVG